jgi:CRISPR-associated exonuclease Cas4
MDNIPEDDYLQLSGIQHFSFCRRQWALIHVERQWAENLRTVEGKLLHERAHDPFFTEKRGDVIITREMPIFSRTMGVSGQCDVVEFRRDDVGGVSLTGRKGKWSPCPIEYKRGKPKLSDADRLQLCAQAMCLEEMLACNNIERAYLYYGEIRRREPVELTLELRDNVKAIFAEMHQYYRRGYTPRVKMTKSCNACSMKDICLPKLPRSEHCAKDYIMKHISDDAIGDNPL